MAEKDKPEFNPNNTATGQLRVQIDKARADFQTNVDKARADFERNVNQARLQYDQAAEKIKQRTGRDLIGAIIAGLIFAGLLLTSLLIFKVLFVPFAMVILGICMAELATAMRFKNWMVDRSLNVALMLAVVPVTYFYGLLWGFSVLVGGTVVLALIALIPRPGSHMKGASVPWKNMLATLFAQGYVGLLGLACVALVAQPDGQWWTITFLIIVVSVDIGAYAIGLNFGKHLMAPKISPKKTWEGFAGAATAAIIAAVLCSWLMLNEPWWFGLIIGPIILFTAVWGDLGESQLKRIIGIKDMSNWLAGHGGFLDRLDSILPSALVMFVIYLFSHAG